MIGKTKTEQISQQDPLSLYEELSLISPGWADQLFKRITPCHGLESSRSCVVGEAHHGSSFYPNKEGTTRCEACEDSSVSIYRTSKEWHDIDIGDGATYDEDKFHAEISKFVTHFKAEHKKGSFK